MGQDVFELLQCKKRQGEIRELCICNENTMNYGLSLSPQEAGELVACRDQSLKKYQRVEFGAGILDKLVFAFCDSQYLEQDDYLKTLEELQDVFYQFKNATEDKMNDEELLAFMREQFENVCMGDVSYLADTCLERLAQAVRGGYRGYQTTGGKGEYEQFSEEKRWDSELYLKVLKESFWE